MAKHPIRNKRQMILLGALLVLVVYYILRTFVLTGPASKARTSSQAANSTPPRSGSATLIQTSRQADNGGQQRIEALLDDKTPLNFELLAVSSGDSKPGPRGNIFDFYHDPPPPPKPPDPPPPITISYIQPQTAVAGTPRPFTMTVSGRAFPPDAKIFLNGGPRSTKRVNDTTVTTEIQPAEYASQGQLNVEVKSETDPKLFSNPMSFVIQAAPDPPFKYVGRIGDIGVLEMNGTKEVARVSRGGTVQGVWRVESITDSGIEVIHSQYQIKKRVVMQDKGR